MLTVKLLLNFVVCLNQDISPTCASSRSTILWLAYLRLCHPDAHVSFIAARLCSRTATQRPHLAAYQTFPKDEKAHLLSFATSNYLNGVYVLSFYFRSNLFKFSHLSPVIFSFLAVVFASCCTVKLILPIFDADLPLSFSVLVVASPTVTAGFHHDVAICVLLRISHGFGV